ncbi:UBP25, partial [Symbiodinium necroappetens]
NTAEKAIQQLLARIAGSPQPTVPVELTNTYYRGRQEDLVEFLVKLLEECPTCDEVLCGTEQPTLQCQHCTYGRPLRAENFHHMQLPMMSSVQAALDGYLERSTIMTDFKEWFCLSSACLTAGIAEDYPLHRSHMANWPRVLMLSLKRWSGPDEVIGDRIFCNRTLKAADRVYDLCSLATHIGDRPESGHYIAYRRQGPCMMKIDDHHVSRLAPRYEDYIVSQPSEKIYVLFYVMRETAEQDATQVRPAKFQKLSAATIIDLEDNSDDNKQTTASTSDSTKKNDTGKTKQTTCSPETKNMNILDDSDSDVIPEDTSMENVQETHPAAPGNSADPEDDLEALLERELEIFYREQNTQAEQDNSNGQAKDSQMSQVSKTRQQEALRRFCEEDRLRVVQLIKKSSTVKEAVKFLKDKFVEFSATNVSAKHYIQYSTLRRWIADPALLDRAVLRASRTSSGNTRVAPTSSARSNLAEEHRATIAESLHAATSWQQFLEMLKQGLPDFSDSNAHATNYIPRTTLRRWFSTSGITEWFPATHESDFDNFFAVAFAVPAQRCQNTATDSFEDQWLLKSSWQFCPNCGRKRARTDVDPTQLRKAHACKPCCDTDAVELLHPPGADAVHKKKAKLCCYVTPLAEHWESLVLELQATGLPLTAAMTMKELSGLAVLDIHVDYRSRRGGHADITSKQKRTVVRCRWKATPLRSMQRSFAASRMFDWLMRNNETYAAWVDRHARLVQEHEQGDAWRELRTAELLLSSPGVEVATRPWLYPLASYADTDLQLRLKKLGWLADNSTPSIRAGFIRKLLSRCLDYSRDFPLHCLLYDTCLAKSITSIINVANQKNIAPEHAAHEQDTFEGYWLLQIRKLEDICRREYESSKEMNRFQSRGTLHVHALLWADLLPGWAVDDIAGRTGQSRSNFLDLLERLFKSRADVQCGDGSHCLLRYVAGYVAKASDALQFNLKQLEGESTWRQAYRLLTKKSPTEQEIIMEFAGLSMVKHSFSGHDVHAPIPGSAARNSSRHAYNAYQWYLTKSEDVFGCSRSYSFVQWLRKFRVTGNSLEDMTLHLHNQRGPKANKPCSVAVAFPFELLDIYVGAWAATCLPGMLEERLLPKVPDDLKLDGFEVELRRRRSFECPAHCEHVRAVLSLDDFQLPGADPDVYCPDLSKFFDLVVPELTLRGLNTDRIATFKAKIEATNMLLLAIHRGLEDASNWSSHRLPAFPRPVWSPEQQQVLKWVSDGLRISDAAAMATSPRILQISGSPCTGKTEVVIGAARMALDSGCAVLIGGPIGLLVAMYKLRLPASELLTMETIHSAFKLTREADEAYIPPGRLRRYDVIILDEVSQIDARAWRQLQTAFRVALSSNKIYNT